MHGRSLTAAAHLQRSLVFKMAVLLQCLSLWANHGLMAQPSALLQKDIIFEQLPNELGLSQRSINCIAQDRDGYLWIGTWSGLVRYDGYTTKTFQLNSKQPHSLQSNKITSILEDKRGNLWIGTSKGGLFRYEKGTESFIQYKHHPNQPNSISNNNVWCMLEDKKGNFWVGTNGGLNLFDRERGSFQRFTHQPQDSSSLSSDLVTHLYQTRSGNIWVGTQKGLNLLQEPGRRDQHYYFKRYYYLQDSARFEEHNSVMSMDELSIDGQETLWVGTMKGLKRLSNGHFQNYEYQNKAPGYSYFRTLWAVEGANPFLLLGSEKGVSIFDPYQEQFVRLLGDRSQRVNLSQNNVTSLFIDRTKVLWVGTKTGLNKFDTYSKNFEFYPTKSFDPSNSIITGIKAAGSGGYWISTMGGGLYQFKPGQKEEETGSPAFQQYKITCRDALEFTDFVQSTHADGQGNLWIGTAGAGVYHFNEKELPTKASSITNYQHFSDKSRHKISDSYIMSFASAGPGAVWVGSWSGGLNKIVLGDTVIQYHNPIFKQAPLVVMHTDQEGTLWIGSRGEGLYRVRERGHQLDIKVYQEPQGLDNKFVEALYEDKAGTLWLGTEGGLYSFHKKTGRLQHHKVSEKGENDAIVSILEDNRGKLWLAHWQGITVFDPSGRQATRRYATQDRIQGGFFYNGVCFKDDNGKLLFGGAAGINLIDPEEVSLNPTLAMPRIERFSIFNQEVRVGEEINGRTLLPKPLSETDRLVLKYLENSVSFEFAAQHYAAPEKIKYAYKLEGFDKEWQHADASRRWVNYTNLPQGGYTFKVKATNPDGIWSEKTSQLRFSISPPWWKADWAMLLYVLAGVIALYLFRMFIIMRTDFIHNLKMERMKRENLEVLSKAKLEFFTNVSHEFRTPLTLIAGPLQRVLESGEGNKFIRQQLMVVNNNTQRLLRLVNQLLDFRKIEAGNLKLQVAEGNMVRFVEEIKLSFEALAGQRQIQFAFKPAAQEINLWYDRDQFEKILYNLLSNAFKNTPRGGQISIGLEETTDEVLISIEDNGRGIHPEHLENIFQRFFSYYEHSRESGASTGIGLALTKSLVDLHRGTIAVESQRGLFTRFMVRLRKGKAHFLAHEIAADYQDSEHIDQYPLPETELPVLPSLLEAAAFNPASELQKILIVEDNADLRAYVKSVFMGKYQILEAENGKEGLTLAQEEGPDLIISDIMMPVMDGITLCRKLKSKIKTSHIPIFLLTARTSLIFKVEGLETGADDYITKPFDARILELKVNNLLKLRAAMRSMFQDSKVLQIEPQKVTLTSADELFIKKALKSVEDNMANIAYAVEDLEQDVNLSRMQLYRKLKALTGQSANEFIRTIRLKRAAQLIEQNQLTIAEVTYEVGFTDLQYFRKCFKKQFGVNPSEYSGQAQNNSMA